MSNEKLPEAPCRWSALIRQHGLSEEGTVASVKISSGSRISLEQFLLLRVLCNELKPGRDLERLCQEEDGPISPKTRRNVKKYLNSSMSWQRYQDRFEAPPGKKLSAFKEESTFDIVTSLHWYIRDKKARETTLGATSRQTRSVTSRMNSYVSGEREEHSLARNPQTTIEGLTDDIAHLDLTAVEDND